jgi:hypothetical protein
MAATTSGGGNSLLVGNGTGFTGTGLLTTSDFALKVEPGHSSLPEWFTASNDGLYSEPPPPRGWHTLTLVDENSALLFGGKGETSFLNDTYILDLCK